jgi:ribosome maturation factor RimP
VGGYPTFFCSASEPRRNVNEALEHIIREELTALGYELVEFRRGGTRNQPSIELRIDRPDGTFVSVEDCALASRAIETRLDGGEVMPENYVLQVSSPGERPLRAAEDWRRFSGRWVSVSGSAVGGRIEGKIVGLEGPEGAEEALIEPARGKVVRVPLSGISEARLAFRI